MTYLVTVSTTTFLIGFLLGIPLGMLLKDVHSKIARSVRGMKRWHDELEKQEIEKGRPLP